MSVTLNQHANPSVGNDSLATTDSSDGNHAETSSLRPLDTSSRQSVSAEHALRGLAMRAHLLPQARGFWETPFTSSPPVGPLPAHIEPLPPSIDGNSRGPTTTVATDPHSQTPNPDDPETRTTTLATGLGVTVTRETTGDGYDGIIITTSSANDTVVVSEGPHGSKNVTVNGQTTNIKLAPGQTLEIRTEGGNDRVVIDGKATATGVVVYGGAGDDHLSVDGNDSGWVQLDGESGNDTIVMSGSGYNEAIGEDGNDTIQASGQQAVVTAGDGDDRVSVSGNNSRVYAGAGNDDISIWGDNNTVITDDGKDHVQVNSGHATVVGDFHWWDIFLGGRDQVTTAKGASVTTKEE